MNEFENSSEGLSRVGFDVQIEQGIKVKQFVELYFELVDRELLNLLLRNFSFL